MKIGVLTYSLNHLKTNQIVRGLIARGIKKIKIIIVPFKKFKKRNPIINHRPAQFRKNSLSKICNKYKIKIIKIEEKKVFNGLDFAIIGGSGIINKKYIKKNFIINCHPGLIPQTRGLDSFKWAILKNNLIVNTLHFIDKEIDEGKILHQKLTKIYKSDTIKTLAKRHYKNEIDLLINFDYHMKKKRIYKLTKCAAYLRMPVDLEQTVISGFNKWKKKFIK